MKIDKDRIEAEELSQIIDMLNNSEKPTVSSQNLNELADLAVLIKHSAGESSMPHDLIGGLAGQLSAELTAKKRSRAFKWLYSGAVGSIAAVLLVTALNLIPVEEVEQGQLVQQPAGQANQVDSVPQIGKIETRHETPVNTQTAAPTPVKSGPSKAKSSQQQASRALVSRAPAALPSAPVENPVAISSASVIEDNKDSLAPRIKVVEVPSNARAGTSALVPPGAKEPEVKAATKKADEQIQKADKGQNSNDSADEAKEAKEADEQKAREETRQPNKASIKGK